MKDYKNMTIAELREIGQPYNPCDTGYWIPMRKVSIYFTKILLPTRLTANHVSLIFLFFSLLAALCLYMGIRYDNLWYYFGVPVFIITYLILDCTDGEIARIKGTASPVAGKVMDVFCHEIFDNAIVVAVTLGIYFKTHNTNALLIGLLLFVGKSINQRLNGIIVRCVRLYEARNPNKEKKKNQSASCETEPKKKNIFKTILEYIPYKGIYLIIFFALLGDQALLYFYLLWAIKFNIMSIYNAVRFFNSPDTYLL